MDIDKEPAKEEKKDESKDEKKKKKREENFEILQNMARVVPAQLKHISFKEDSRYVPLKKTNIGGIMMLLDTRPDEEEELIQPSAPSSGKRHELFSYGHTLTVPFCTSRTIH